MRQPAKDGRFGAAPLSNVFFGVNGIYTSLNRSEIRHAQPFPLALSLNLL